MVVIVVDDDARTQIGLDFVVFISFETVSCHLSICYFAEG